MHQKNLITATGISFETDQGKTLFQDLDISVSSGEKIGLIGDNGSGKTTLLKIIAGLIKPNLGFVINNSNVQYFPQLNLEIYKEGKNIFEFLTESSENWWDVLLLLEKHFQITLSEERVISTLSGGELMKLVICQKLALMPDLLLLDEPTNHIDLETKEELVKMLNNSNIAYVVVSHDIDFLNKVTSKIIYLNGGKLRSFGGNYDFFQGEIEKENNARESDYKSKLKDIKKTKNALITEHNRAQRSKSQTTKINNEPSKDKFAKGFFRNRSEKGAGRKKLNLEGQLTSQSEELSSLKKVNKKKAYFDIKDSKPTNHRLFVLENGNLYIDSHKLQSGLNFELAYGDRIWLKGRNGSGKSSLINALLNQIHSITSSTLKMDGLKVFGNNIKTMYLSQKYEIVNPELDLLENILSINPEISYEQARRSLGNFLFFEEDEISKKAKFLSGGEVARLAFAMLTISEIDLLVLDEPTNNLDISTKKMLEEALLEFPGAMIVISHDETFVQKLIRADDQIVTLY